MTRPTWPAGPFPDDDPASQPRFVPRQGPETGPQPGSHPYDLEPTAQQPPFPPAPPPPAAPPHAAPPHAAPPHAQPPGPAAAQAAPTTKPTFTPHPQGPDGRQGARHARGRDGRPRPTFTPHEGYLPPGGRQRPAYLPTAFLAPPGYPQPSFQPFAFPQVAAPPRPAPRFVPADRPGDQGRAAPPHTPDAWEPEDDGGSRTRVFEPSRDGLASTGPQPTAGDTSPNLVQSSKIMALGTLASRLTGFLRTLVLVAALGSSGLADAYNNSNTLPNTVYYLMLGGVFTSVVVPLLVRAAKEDPDRGEGYAERIFTLGVISLLIVTVLGTALAGPFVDLYAGNISNQAEHRVMVIFAYYFIPQIFFYGMDSLLGAILNVRGRFGPNMWTPVINNVVVIIVGLLFILTEGLHRTPGNISPGGVQLLAIGTTLGILIQSIVLFPVLRRAGFSMRLRWDLRRDEIGEIGRMSGWLFGYVFTQWLGNLIVQRVANAAANTAVHHGHITGVGYSAYSYAYQLFQLPYAIVGISVISALLPRMSGHATERRYSLVRDDFSKGVRLASVIVMPSAVFLAVLGAPLCEFLFSIGSMSWQDARYIGEVFGMFSLGLIPFMVTQLQLRVFYSFYENRTPAIIGMVMLAVGVIGDLVALTVLPPTQTVIGLAFAYDLMTLSGAVLSWPLLLRRVGSLDGWRITRSLIRMFLATLPGLFFVFVVMAITGSLLHHGPAYGLAATVVGGGGALLLYALFCRMLGIEEFRTLMRSVAGRFG